MLGIAVFTDCLPSDGHWKLAWTRVQSTLRKFNGELIIPGNTLVLLDPGATPRGSIEVGLDVGDKDRVAVFYQGRDEANGDAVLLVENAPPVLVTYAESAVTRRRICDGPWRSKDSVRFRLVEDTWRMEFGPHGTCFGERLDTKATLIGLGTLSPSKPVVRRLTIDGARWIAPSYVALRYILAGLLVVLLISTPILGRVRPRIGESRIRALLSLLVALCMVFPTRFSVSIYPLVFLQAVWPAIRRRIGKARGMIPPLRPSLRGLLAACFIGTAVYVAFRVIGILAADPIERAIPSVTLDPMHPVALEPFPGQGRLAFDLTLPEGGILEVKTFAELTVHPLDGIPEDSPGSGNALFVSALAGVPNKWVRYSPLRARVRDLDLPPIPPGETRRIEIVTNGIRHEARIGGVTVYEAIADMGLGAKRAINGILPKERTSDTTAYEAIASAALGVERATTISASRPGTRIEHLTLSSVPKGWRGPLIDGLLSGLVVLVHAALFLILLALLQHGVPRGRGWWTNRIEGGLAWIGVLGLSVVTAPQGIPVTALGLTTPDLVRPSYWLVTFLTLLACRLSLPRPTWAARSWRRVGLFLLMAAAAWECMARMTSGLAPRESSTWHASADESFLTWRLNPSLWLLNQGRAIANLRGRGIPECGSREPRAWGVYGGSVAFGWAFDSMERSDYPAQLEDLLVAQDGGSSGDPWHVHNVGWPGATVYTMAERDGAYGYSRCLTGAIVSLHFNDTQLGTPPPEWHQKGRRRLWLPTNLARDLRAWFESHGSFLFREMAEVWLGLSRVLYERVPGGQLEWYEQALRSFVSELRGNGVTRILFVSEDCQERSKNLEKRAGVMKAVAESEGIPYVDAEALLARFADEPVHLDAVHLSRRGGLVVAEEIRRVMAEQGWL